jgi:hypothetical protein
MMKSREQMVKLLTKENRNPSANITTTYFLIPGSRNKRRATNHTKHGMAL